MNLFFIFFFIFSIDFYECLSNDHIDLDKELCQCKPYSNLKSRIIEGNPVSKDDFKFVVSIFVKREDNENQHICMGIILNPTYILSSAQCTLPITQYNKTLYVNGGLDHDLKNIYSNSNNNERTISKIHKHPQNGISSTIVNGEKFNYSKNDIALLELSSPLKLGSESNLYPACLYSKEFDLEHDLIIAGYGLTHNSTIKILSKQELSEDDKKESNSFATDIKNTKLNSITLKQGTPDDYRFYNLTKNQFILANNPNGSVCEGDRGAPLGINHNNKFYVVSVLNFFWSVKEGNVIKRCLLNSFSFSTPVFKILNWIDSVVKLKNTCMI